MPYSDDVGLLPGQHLTHSDQDHSYILFIIIIKGIFLVIFLGVWWLNDEEYTFIVQPHT